MAGLAHGTAKDHILILIRRHNKIRPKTSCSLPGLCPTVRRSIETFLESDLQNTVEIAWCPGHEGREGNEKADKLKKKLVNYGHPHSIPLFMQNAGPKLTRWTARRRSTTADPFEADSHNAERDTPS
ncbi:hypothetical protein F5876DRAFT_30886 [Lentinula aff. lateritia]|uniref:Uncharacterized protein n=1 Tax=Lentinula aff. lateritia TaxID=2804960 RepID=A0ACC1UDT4_9AGAR|nr:hypothetical protein F5876DRAFT_30886 [Lentinula aff. lateritia]